jgi:GTP:adenosylcobinamide-phosphate guanylyltransferase
MNAFVLAGDQGPNGLICGINKAFLVLEGRPLLIHVLNALDQVRQIDRIYVVGPQKQIMAAIERALPEILFTKKIEVLQQKESLVENLLSAYAYSLPGYQEGVDPRRLTHSDEPALFLPADIPFVIPSEIEAFISNADMEKYDYCMGVTPEESLAAFYPKQDQPGIKLPYLYLKEKAYRMNNLHLARPYRIGAGGYVQRMYDHRHQKYIGNRLRVAFEILRTPRWPKGLFFYLLAQGASFFTQAGLSPIASFFRRSLALPKVEKETAFFLKTRFKAVETDIGSAALDIDDEGTYKTMSLLFKEWRAYFARFDEKKRGEFCPFETEACGRDNHGNRVKLKEDAFKKRP